MEHKGKVWSELKGSLFAFEGQVGLMLTITNQEFSQLTAYIKANYGIHLKDEKRALVTGRLHNVLSQNNFRNFSEYYEYILKLVEMQTSLDSIAQTIYSILR